MIPVSTGLARGIERLLPELAGRIQAKAIRVPTVNVSCLDITLQTARDTSAEEINRVLTDQQIQTNFSAGVGEKFYLLFSVSHLVNVPEAYILFEVSQFDSYSYLFDKPTFISLDASAGPGSIPVAGLRISGSFSVDMLAGGHFFIHEHEARVLRLIKDQLSVHHRRHGLAISA